MKNILGFEMFNERLAEYSTRELEDVILDNFKKAAKELNLKIEVDENMVTITKDSFEATYDLRTVDDRFEKYENVKKELESRSK